MISTETFFDEIDACDGNKEKLNAIRTELRTAVSTAKDLFKPIQSDIHLLPFFWREKPEIIEQQMDFKDPDFFSNILKEAIQIA